MFSESCWLCGWKSRGLWHLCRLHRWFWRLRLVTGRMRFAFARNGRLYWSAGKSAEECFGIWILASRLTGARWAKNHGCRTHSLGIYRTARSPRDAEDEPLASSAVGAFVDDLGHADGRWLALVRAGDHFANRWRASEVFRDWGGGGSGSIWDFCV